MKRFKLMKGMIACLLSLALVLGVIAPVSLNAAPVPNKVTVANNANDLVDVTIKKSGSGESAESAQSISAGSAISGGDTIYVTVEAKSGKNLSEVKIGGSAVTATSGKYTKEFKIGEGGTSAASGLEVVVDATEAFTLTAVYVPETDTIEFTSSKQTGKVYFASVKKAGSKIGKKYGSVDLKNGKATLVLNNKDTGLNISSDKDLFLWYGLDEPDEKSKKKVSPLFTVNGNKVKPTVALNYAAAGDPNRSAITSVTMKSGKTNVKVDIADVSYCYASDGTTFGEWAKASTLKGDALATAINAVSSGSKPAYKFRVDGKAVTAEEETETETSESGSSNSASPTQTTGEVAPTNDGGSAPETSGSATATSGSGTATSAEPTPETPAKVTANIRGSKIAVVKVKGQAAAPKVKVDYKKGFVTNVKNGFDFAVKSTSGEVALDEWTTILKYNKNAKTKDTDTVKTNTYTPVKSVSDDAYAFTAATKRKNTSVDDLFKACGTATDTIYVYVRKSADDKSPASAATCVVIKKPAAATTFGNTVNVTGEKGKKGYSYKLEFPEKFSEGYEYITIKEGDDYSKVKSWKKVSSKGITVGKEKTTTSKTLVKADGNFYVLIRKAVVNKGENAAFASEITWTKINAAVTSGSGDAETSKLVWEACDAPVAESSNSGESSGSGEDATQYTVTVDTNGLPAGATLSVVNGETAVEPGTKVDAGTTLTFTLTAADGKTFSEVKFGGEDWAANDDKYVKEVTVNEDITITVTAEYTE